ATDLCGNHTDTTVVYTWTADTTRPSIVTVPTASDLGCNPGTPPDDAGIKAQVTANDTCSAATITVTHSDGASGCVTTRTFAISATDLCGNHTDTTVVRSEERRVGKECRSRWGTEEQRREIQ